MRGPSDVANVGGNLDLVARFLKRWLMPRLALAPGIDPVSGWTALHEDLTSGAPLRAGDRQRPRRAAIRMVQFGVDLFADKDNQSAEPEPEQ